jgi:endoglucanase
MLFLGEVGVPNTDGCKAWDNLHNYMLDNHDVWEGFTAWAAGPSDWWGNNRFYCGPGSKSLANLKKALTGA